MCWVLLLHLVRREAACLQCHKIMKQVVLRAPSSDSMESSCQRYKFDHQTSVKRRPYSHENMARVAQSTVIAGDHLQASFFGKTQQHPQEQHAFEFQAGFQMQVSMIYFLGGSPLQVAVRNVFRAFSHSITVITHSCLSHR